MPASMSFYFLKVPPQSVALDVGISIYRYVSGIFAPRNSSLSQSPQAPTGKGVADFSPANGIARSPFTAPVCIKGAQAGAPITEYHPEGGSAEIQFRIDQIPSATPKPVTPPKASSLQPVQFKLHGHIGTPTISSPRMCWLGTPNSPRRLEGPPSSGPGRNPPCPHVRCLRTHRATRHPLRIRGRQFSGSIPRWPPPSTKNRTIKSERDRATGRTATGHYPQSRPAYPPAPSGATQQLCISSVTQLGNGSIDFPKQ